MGVRVSSFDEFSNKLSNYRKRSVIFGFLLFDSRPSQEVINVFTQRHDRWIDELATSAKIYFFFPFKREKEDFINPSVEIAGIFEIGVSRLPGVILFAPPGKGGKVTGKRAVYIPLKERDFNDRAIYEPILVDLFELIKKSIKNHKKSELVLSHIKKELAKLRRRKVSRGFGSHIRKGLIWCFSTFRKQFMLLLQKGLARH